MGGRGLTLPFNSLTVICVSILLLLLVVWHWESARYNSIDTRPAIYTSTAWRYLCIGVGLAAIPLIFNPTAWLSQALWHFAGLIFGMIAYFILLQCRMRAIIWRQGVSASVIFMTVVQAIIAVIQIFWPDWSPIPFNGNRPYGIFQQPNVLGSFLSTGLAVCLMTFILPGFRMAGRTEYFRSTVLAFCLTGLSLVLVWVQSRAAWLGACVVVTLMLICLRRYSAYPSRMILASLLVLAGIVVGECLSVGLGDQYGGVRYVSHEGSNDARWSMLCNTLSMIARHPIQGWGYGSFAFAFQHFRVSQSVCTVVNEIARHPHNELLFWWVEGGIAGLAAVLLWAGTLLVVWRQSIRHDIELLSNRYVHAGEATGWCLTLLPLLIHTQLEYPFYQSAPHALLFLLLLVMADRCGGVRTPLLSNQRHVNLVRATLIAALACVIIVMIMAFSAGRQLTAIERDGLRNTYALQTFPGWGRWISQERWLFDRQVNLLLIWNRTHEDALLQKYADWAKNYLIHDVDAGVYASLITILRYQLRPTEAELYRREAAVLYPTDRRFAA
ncbi:PglL family O-oligosaccharyltransferase [Enterobacter roggenkampii]|uniref:PglL family O-oligosaccharyltransferase n=1 Tax=Enterobacter roggenkampii TaxID=1812935 RepID=UPI00277D14A5|nr:Wzy polymerase domain-containing protein [Enterobacter roggenkampii]